MNSQEEFSEAVNDGFRLVSGENELYKNGDVICVVGPGISFSGVNLSFSNDENFVRLIGRNNESRGSLFVPDWEVKA